MKAVWEFLRFNWRIILLCVAVAFVVALLMRSDRNRGRFVIERPYAFDTRTGQYCSPYPKGKGLDYLPRCADLAKWW